MWKGIRICKGKLISTSLFYSVNSPNSKDPSTAFCCYYMVQAWSKNIQWNIKPNAL